MIYLFIFTLEIDGVGSFFLIAEKFKSFMCFLLYVFLFSGHDQYL